VITLARPLLPALVAVGVACVACTGGEPAATDESAAIALPGDEVLTSPPPDPAAGNLQEQLTRLATGELRGDLDLQLSGLATFDESVVGSCDLDGETPRFAATLADGSALELLFTGDGGELSVLAPGVVVEETLSDVDLDVAPPAMEVHAQLLTAGTSEVSGRLTLQGRCG
jgi:hypothetical protein